MENIYADDFDTTQDHPGFEWSRMRLAKRLGGEMLGASVYLLGPGQRSFPYHFHHANEEMLVVLEGDVLVRTSEGEESATRGDTIIFRRGSGGGHQVTNPGDEPARILMMSTMIEPDVAEYPDSGNIGVFARRSGGLAKILDGSAEADYFRGT